jgi:hypothetical protein
MLKKCVFLHVGFHKTGTTALQEAFSKNGKFLSDSGILFPQGLSDWPSHPELAWSFTGNIFPWQDKIYAIDKVSQFYRELIEEAPEQTIILSSEELCRLNYYPGTIESLSELFTGIDTRIIAYARSPREFLASRYRHEVQQGTESQSFADFLSNPDNLDSARFDRRMVPWANAFPGKVQLRYYDRSSLIDGNIISDFLNIIGFDNLKIRGNYEDTELQMHPTLAPFMSLVNRTEMPDDDRSAVFNTVLDLSRRIPKARADLLYDEADIPRAMLRMLSKLDEEVREMVDRLAKEYSA